MSRVNFGAKPNMYPLPVLIIATYDKDGNPDAMNAAWGVVTDFNEISISMGDHKTTDNLAATGAFTVSMATEDTVVGCDYVGIESGRKVKESTLYPILKKLEKAGYVTTYSAEYQGRKRKYYSITEAGKTQMAYLQGEWKSYRDTIDNIIEWRKKE